MFLFSKTLMAALEEVMGSIFSEKQKETFWNQLGVVIKPHVRSDKYIFIYHFIVNFVIVGLYSTVYIILF